MLGIFIPTSPANAVQQTSVVSLDAGGNTTCALRAGNKVFCVGDNSFGQLGDGTTVSQSEPVFTGVSGALTVAVGSRNVCSIDSDQRGICWGDNSKGQLGSSVQGTTPRRIDLSLKLVDISVGETFACAVTDTGLLYCWGEFANYSSAIVQHTPTIVSGISGVKSVSVGKNTVCVLSTDVYCLGQIVKSDNFVQIPNTNGAAAISVGQDFACSLVVGSVRCWGDNSQGQLGQGDFSVQNSLVNVIGISDAIAISTGSQFACALTSSATFCWGDNSSSQIAAGTSDQATRVPVAFVTPVAITSGSNYSCALLQDASVKCIGDNSKGQSGVLSSSITPLTVTGRGAAVEVSAGTDTTCVIDTNNNLNCWGVLKPELPSGSKYSTVAVGDASACAVGSDSKVYCWGSNSAGQLGDGSNRSSTVPVVVTGFGTRKVNHISAGFRHFCASTEDGLIFCWGDNSKDQLGYTGIDSKTAVAVGGVGTATNVAVGDYHSCALLGSKEVICWGDNAKRQITSEAVAKVSPTLLSGVTNVKKITASTGNTCWLLNDGVAKCIGDNSEGQAPGTIAGSFVDIGIANKTTCLVRVTSALVSCLGSNNANKLGRAGLKSSVLVDIVGITASSVSVGSDHVCALGSLGNLSCWGSNSSGQLASSFGFPSAYAAPTLIVSGKKNVGEILTLADFTKDFGTTVEISWYRATSLEGSFSKISNQTAASLYLGPSDLQRYFLAQVVLHKWGTSSIAYRSSANGPIAGQLKILMSTVPLISGKNKVGSSLRVSAGRWESGVKFSVQWYRGSVAIKGATNNTYKLTTLDVGKQISVWVTGTKGQLPKLVMKSAKTSKISR